MAKVDCPKNKIFDEEKSFCVKDDDSIDKSRCETEEGTDTSKK